MYDAGRASNIELLILVSNVKINSRLDNTPSMRMHRKKKEDSFCTSRVGTFILLLSNYY